MSRPSEHHAGLPLRASTAADEERLGHVIDGRYRLDAVVGRGGMGLVYKAEHVGIRRTVALKLLHTTLASVPELRSRFEREARAIGVISHPNCVDVSDFGELDDGSLYLVMEYLEGRTLGDILDLEQVIDPRRALHILRHVLAGVGHAHQAGIVHRDVKPENVVLVDQDGDPDFAKVCDFGIAKLLDQTVDDGVKLTQAGVAFGTPVYMSPEQALGNPVDPRADLYAASVMAFEMVCGRPPFYSDDKLEVLSMHTARPVPQMDEVRRGVLGPRTAPVPPAFERVIAKGLAKQPRDRWQTADDYIQAIDAALVAIAHGDEDPPTGARPLVTQTGRSLIIDGAHRAPELTPTALSTAAPPRDDGDTPTGQAALPQRSEPMMALPAIRAAPPRAGVVDRIATWARRRPRTVVAAGAGFIVVLAAIMVIASSDRGPDGPRRSEAATAAAALL
jgi:eukaryotic-like serine/threonine-protein kinase